MLELLFSILLAVIGLGVLIAWHEFGHYIVARLTGMRVLQFSIGFGPKIISFTRKDIEYRIGLLPIGGFVQIAGMTELEEGALDDPRAFINRPLWAKLCTIAAGPLFNYFLAFVIYFFVLCSWSSQTSPGMILGVVEKESPAQIAGIQNKDVLLKIDGIDVAGTSDFLNRIKESRGRTLSFLIERNGQQLTIPVTPKATDGTPYRIGVGGFRLVSLPPGWALTESASSLWNQSAEILRMLGRIVTGNQGTEGLGGPVAIAGELKNAVSRGVGDLFAALAGLSVVLGLFNILPIPALDGSKIFFLLIEGIIRRRIPAKVQLVVHLVGIILILGLMIFLTVGDVRKIYNGS